MFKVSNQKEQRLNRKPGCREDGKRHTCRMNAILVTLVVALLGLAVSKWNLIREGVGPTQDGENPSIPGWYRTGAVATDVGLCSKMGRDILKRGGSAVDASITSLLCVGVVNAHTSGLGGGMFMLIYHKSTGKADALMARERAPAAATVNMTKVDRYLDTAVPGELSGMWEAHQRYGCLPWRELFQPVIQLAEEGFPVTEHITRGFRFIDKNKYIPDLARYPHYKGLMARYLDPATALWKVEGDIAYAPRLARTLRAIAMNGASELYSGETSRLLFQDVQERGGFLTAADLESYSAEWREAPAVSIGRGMTVLSTPSPSSGPLVQFILSIVKHRNMSSADFESAPDKAKVYHWFVEASKFAFALKPYLGDVETLELQKVLEKLQSDEHARSIFSRIQEDGVTFTNASDYGELGSNGVQEGGSTSHISVVDQFGNAVSATSSINKYFASGLSRRTGMILNNQMLDFTTPEDQPVSSANYIAPGKRPFSAMAPMIVLNENKEAELIVGSSGSSAIININAWTILRAIFTDASLQEIIDERRLNHDLQSENAIIHEKGFPQEVIDNLKAMGHKTKMRRYMSVVQAIRRLDNGWMAYSDPRKQGYAAGY
ncbi:gamma-glutamyltranspeptidase 1-like isoform X2 [Acanthaster planci]|uniref:Gamma-glutamyltranspeptidase 1-like isoform X2 n=1 Tax=Acanthaster planci TaxID=133434 RepID=A0A8B7ZTF0_ACAPL|nr:gamma-glutamyltranspeptidase 1-like isoform X2 [Acanthaster planci]